MTGINGSEREIWEALTDDDKFFEHGDISRKEIGVTREYFENIIFHIFKNNVTTLESLINKVKKLNDINKSNSNRLIKKYVELYLSNISRNAFKFFKAYFDNRKIDSKYITVHNDTSHFYNELKILLSYGIKNNLYRKKQLEYIKEVLEYKGGSIEELVDNHNTDGLVDDFIRCAVKGETPDLLSDNNIKIALESKV